MTISNNATFTVADSSTQSASATTTVMPAVGVGTGGRGRLVHPSLGTYDYANTPNETVNFYGSVITPPKIVHQETLTGGVDTIWDGYVKDVVVIERWKMGDVGATVALLDALMAMWLNPPSADAGLYVRWYPNYATANSWYVIIQALRCGGQEVSIDRRLAGYGYTPQPLELEMRIVSAA